MLFYLLSCLILCCLYWLYRKPSLYWEKKGIFYVHPWARTLRVFWNTKSFYEIIIDAYREFPNKRYYGSYQFLRPALFVRDLDLIKQITVKDFEYFPDHFNMVTNESDPVLNLNLFSLEGEKWKDMRSTLSPAFTSSKMRTMYTLIQETANNFIKHFYEEVGDKVMELEMRTTFSKFSNDVIANCAFGVQCDSLKNDKNDFFQMALRVITPNPFNFLKTIIAGFFPLLLRLFRISIFPFGIISFFQNLVKETIGTREKHSVIRPDMIHLLMEARKGRLKHEVASNDADTGFATVEESSIGKSHRKMEITDDVITAQALIFFFAGFSTISSTLSFLAYHLAVDQDVQVKLRKEIDDVLENSSGNVSYEEILRMKYLDQVVSETLRMYSPGFVLTRVCVKDYVIKAKLEDEIDFKVDKGLIVSIPTCGIHYDPKYFPNPEKFDPDRFSDENKGNIVPGSYMPFGAGPRNCIGSRFALLEIKALAVSLLRQFEIVPVEKTVIPIKLSKTFDVSIKGGCWLGLKRRKV